MQTGSPPVASALHHSLQQGGPRCRSCGAVGKAIPSNFNPYPPLPGHMATATPEGRTDGVTGKARHTALTRGSRPHALRPAKRDREGGDDPQPPNGRPVWAPRPTEPALHPTWLHGAHAVPWVKAWGVWRMGNGVGIRRRVVRGVGWGSGHLARCQGWQTALQLAGRQWPGDRRVGTCESEAACKEKWTRINFTLSSLGASRALIAKKMQKESWIGRKSMLVDFTVSNFRSISKPATLSLIAGPAAARKGRFSFVTGNSFASHVLRSAVILGPNGSGKTSLTDAFRFFNHFVATSGRSGPSDKIDWPRNKLVQGEAGDVASFEATFVADGTLYEYGFKISEEQVHDEWLFSRASKAGSQMRPVFERILREDGAYSWKLNEARLPGMRDTWRKATRPNALFLSTAVQLNAKSLVSPFYWITEQLNTVGSGGRIWPDFTARLLDDPATAKRVSAIIRSMDISFSSYRIAAEEFEPLPPSAENLLLPEALNELRKNIGQVQEHKIYPRRLDQDGHEVEFKFEELSDGEQVILGLVGPILDVLTEGETLVVDELSNSLHPLALRAVVGLFNNSDVNKGGAQLIFTSHEASLINSKYLHRDQIWFVENPDGEGTQLTPLSDFSVRESEAFDRGYLGGRYGALPQLKDVRDAFAE